MRTIIIISIILSTLIGVVYYLQGYRSAFEADQQCHYEINIQKEEGALFACDHDLETRQWLLYKKAENQMPSVVLKRFRY